MAEQYTGHVSPPVSRDHFTALPLVEFLVKQYRRINNIMNYIIKNRNNKYKIRLNLSYNSLSLGYHRFQIGCMFAEFDLFKPSTFIQNCI